HASSGKGEDGVTASSSSGTGSSSSGMGAQVTMNASVAACVNEVVDDAAACEQAAGLGQMSIDTSDPNLLSENDGFVRFDLDATLTGKTIDAVTLELTVASGANAGSDHSGEIWQVSSFTLSSLDVNPPSKVGMMPIGADQGPVSPSQMVKWALPK